MHQDLIFYAPGGVGGQAGAFGGIKGGDSLDEPDGADGDQILLIGSIGIVFFARLKLAEGKIASNFAPNLR